MSVARDIPVEPVDHISPPDPFTLFPTLALPPTTASVAVSATFSERVSPSDFSVSSLGSNPRSAKIPAEPKKKITNHRINEVSFGEKSELKPDFNGFFMRFGEIGRPLVRA